MPDEVNTSVAPQGATASDEEIRKAKELLRANGYGLVGYREAGEKVKRAVGSGVDFIKGKGKAFGGWLSAKRDELKARQEEQRRAVDDNPSDVPKCASCGAGLVPGARFCRKCGKPVSAVGDVAAAETHTEAGSESGAVEDSAGSGSGAHKCAVCGAALAVGVKFCGQCGTPVHAEARKP